METVHGASYGDSSTAVYNVREKYLRNGLSENLRLKEYLRLYLGHS